MHGVLLASAPPPISVAWGISSSKPACLFMALTLRRGSFGVTVGLEGGAESVGLAGDGPPRHTHRKPDLVAGRDSIQALQHRFKIEGQLELADHPDRWVISAQRDQITAAASPLTVKPSTAR